MNEKHDEQGRFSGSDETKDMSEAAKAAKEKHEREIAEWAATRK